MTNLFRFTGREKLPGSVLYHYRARTYDPNVGRFISKDPIALAVSIGIFALQLIIFAIGLKANRCI